MQDVVAGCRFHETRAQAVARLVDLPRSAKIELVILKRMREFTLGEHRSRSTATASTSSACATGRPATASRTSTGRSRSLTNFAPLVIRDFEQPSTAGVVVVADGSASTRCGAGGVPLAAVRRPRARGARIGMSAVFFQDPFGLVTFQGGFEQLPASPRTGRRTRSSTASTPTSRERGLEDRSPGLGSLSGSLAGFLRKTSLVPVVSDFLFDDIDRGAGELAHVNAPHDVFLVLIEARSPSTAGGVGGLGRGVDVETGRVANGVARTLPGMAGRVRGWQDEVALQARDAEPRRGACWTWTTARATSRWPSSWSSAGSGG